MKKFKKKERKLYNVKVGIASPQCIQVLAENDIAAMAMAKSVWGSAHSSELASEEGEEEAKNTLMG